MAEYFNFCPKCGRVLDRDWCTHCDPQKETEFRRNQLKLDQNMFEDYSKDALPRRFFGKQPPKVKFPGKTVTSKKYYESGRESRRENRAEGRGEFFNEPRISEETVSRWKREQTAKKSKKAKKKKGKISWAVRIISIVFIILPLLTDLLAMGFRSIKDTDIIKNLEIPKELREAFSNNDDVELNSVIDDDFQDLSYEDFMDELPYRVRFDFLSDEEDSSSIRYKVEDHSYSHSIARPYFVDENREELSIKAQEQINQFCNQWYEAALKDKQNKAKVSCYVQGYTTYLDESKACIVIKVSRYDDAVVKAQYSVHSYFVDLETGETWKPDYDGKENLEASYQDIEDTINKNRFSEEDFLKMVQDGAYTVVVDRVGDYWASMIIDDGYPKLINIPIGGNLYD